MSGGGKSSTSTSSVSIPPEVLARYNAVNARAESVAQQPFTPYGGQFVAPLTQTQQAGIANVSQAAGAAQPYYQAAGTALLGGAAQAQPYYQAATQDIYGGQAAAAPLQTAAAQNIAGAQAAAQPYQGMATGFGLAGARQIAPGGLNVGAYMSPYTEAVAQPTYQALRQQQEQERQRMLGEQIRGGAFGGDRGKIAQANLAQQQNLATAQALGNIYQQGYGQALGAAQQQQGVALQAEQANRQAQQQAANQFLGIGQQAFGQGAQTAQQQAALGQQLFGQGAQAAQTQQALGQGLYGIGAGVSQGLAGLGTGAQQAALQGGQAQLAAGTVEQQTQQAQNQALYNQFLQQQGYPFQVAQFLANIAMGTGALSGSTTTTTQPQSFFSDERLKHDIEPIGKTYDGQEIVRFKYKGEPGTRIGLVAQDVEKKHPEAVGLARGYKTVDYDKATDEAAERAPHKAYGGGLNPWAGSSMGGGVFRENAGQGFAAGGAPGDDILAQINQLVNAHQGIYPYGKSGLYGASSGKSGPYGSSLMQVSPRLMTATPHRMPEPEAAKFLENVGKVGSAAQTVSGGLGAAERGYDWVANRIRGLSTPSSQPYTGPVGGGYQREELPPVRAHGGEVRAGLAIGGMPFSEAQNEYIPEELSKPLMPQTLQAAKTPTQQQGGLGSIVGGLGDVGKGIEGAGKIADFGEKAWDIGVKVAPYVAAMFLSRGGGLMPRKGYQPGGEVTVPEEWQPHIQEASRRYGVPEHILTAVARQESGYGRAAPDNPMQIIESTAREPGFGLSPISREDRARPEAFLPWAAQYIAARNPNMNWEDRPAAARALAATYNAGGDPNYAHNVGRYLPGITPEELAGLRVNVSNEQPRQPQTGLGAVQPEALPILQGLTTRRDPESKDFMQRNQDWIVPLLTGLGTMAASPSRYLGSAVLQGLGGGALQYAGMQQRGEEQAIQREQVDVSRLREINQAMQMQEQMRQRLLESFGPILEGNQYLNPYTGQLIPAEQRMAIVNAMMSNMARQMGLPAMTGAEAAGGVRPGQRPAQPQPPVEPTARVEPPAPAPTEPALETPAQAGVAPPPPAAAPPRPTAATPPPAAAPATPTTAAPSAADVILPNPQTRSAQIASSFAVDASNVDDNYNPLLLQRQAATFEQRANAEAAMQRTQNASNLRAQATELRQRASRILNGQEPAYDKQGNEFVGYIESNRDRTRYFEEQKDVEKNAAAHVNAAKDAYDSMKNMTENYQRGFEFPGGSSQVASLLSYVRNFLPSNTLPESWANFEAAVNRGNKEAIRDAFSQLPTSGMSRGTNMALREMLMAVPSIEMAPRARYEIITSTMAAIERDNSYYRDALRRDPRQSIGEFQLQWESDPRNSLSQFKRHVRNNTAAFSGMSAEDVRELGAPRAAIPRDLQQYASTLQYDRNTGQFRRQVDERDNRPIYEYYDVRGNLLGQRQ
jgi:hypothetical protein